MKAAEFPAYVAYWRKIAHCIRDKSWPPPPSPPHPSVRLSFAQCSREILLPSSPPAHRLHPLQDRKHLTYLLIIHSIGKYTKSARARARARFHLCTSVHRRGVAAVPFDFGFKCRPLPRLILPDGLRKGCQAPSLIGLSTLTVIPRVCSYRSFRRRRCPNRIQSGSNFCRHSRTLEN